MPPAVIQNDVVAAFREIDVGSVSCRRTPVSPVTPLRIMDCAFPEGGTIVTAVVDVLGTVIVFAPDDRVWIVIDPGLVVFEAAAIVSVPVTSPVKTIVIVLVEVTAMFDPLDIEQLNIKDLDYP